MQKTLDLIRAFARDEDGVTAMEYGLIAGFLSLVIVAGLTLGGPALKGIFDTIGNQLVAAQKAMTA
ncbi:Flp pilus assembly protein, pilin Flp [Paraburkholderia piptadeniae]|uniref:Flp pilus assembly protein, pilin Flp n=1 Tax=Paraburkholderia piptadeniae TaxID=1701573 RepID=A0A1N7SEX2_9BURK|nr:Flp family type IVb pilin [Paraburkholderia piptadeniae]SIT45927.1 Flp pilus assembly protein, pilin Flp [Paraburkholderia piptadeniae]